MIYYTKDNNLFNLLKYSYKWNYWILSKNPNLTEEFILKQPNKSWDIEYLIKNNKIINFNALTKFRNINQDIINKYLNKPWDWEWLIENTNIKVEYYIPFDLIKKYNYKWNYYYLSENLNITEEFILKYPHQNWNIRYLIDNNKITNFIALSKFKKINKYIIEEYPNKPWDWEWLIENTNINIKDYISLDLIKKYKNKQNYYLNYNSNFTENFILKYPYQDWNIEYLINNKINDFIALTKFKNINQYIIDNYSNKPWDWEWLIENTDINIEYHIPFNLIEKYSYKWDYWNLSYNPSITEKFILKYPYQDWNIEYLIENNKITNFIALSRFKYINQNIVNKYINNLWDWDWEWLTENTKYIGIKLKKYIPFDIIEKYPYKWGYWYLSYHPELTEEFILKYPNKNWNKDYLVKKFIFKKIFYKFEIK